MVKTRSKKTNEPVPVTQASRSRKRQTSNADEVQNKQTKIDDDEESNDDQSKKKKGKGTKKKGKQPWYVISTLLRSIFLIFFFAGKRLHRKLPRMLQLMLQVLLFIYPSKYSRLLTNIFLIPDIYRSERILEASGITVAPPERPRSTSHISRPSTSVPSTQRQNQCQHRPPPKSESSDDEDDDSEGEDNDEDEDNNEDEEDNDKDEDNDKGNDDSDGEGNTCGPNAERIIPALTTLVLSTATPAEGVFYYFNKYNVFKIKFRIRR